jgi:mannose-6-phosphate isomerase-like protein (cupin superfamily)
MKPYIANIQDVTLQNPDYRRVLFTSNYTQLVVMSLKPGEEIGNEIHGLDQFIRIESGTAKVILNNGESTQEITDDFVIIVPAGTWHNLVNIGSSDLKLYTLYSPPAHLATTLQSTKADEVEDHFDGHTS